MQISTILFDLDDTLYPTQSGVWSLIREKIDSYMVSRLKYEYEEVASARENLFRKYGTTLRGLQAVHNINSRDYLDYVHDVPIESLITRNPKLNQLLDQIPQKKIIFTNADRTHAKRVCQALGIEHHFHQIIDIIDVDPYCKPMPRAFEKAFEILSIEDPRTVLLLDDSAANIQTAKSFGMHTVRINHHDPMNTTSDMEIAKIEDFIGIMTELLEI